MKNLYVMCLNIYNTHKEKILYLIFGGFTTVINYIVRFAGFFVFELTASVSVVAAWIVAVIFAYITNKLIVFGSKKTDAKTMLRETGSFFAARVMSLGISVVISFIFIDTLGLNLAWQQFIVMTVDNIIVIIFNYFASKYFIFNKK